MSLNHVIGNGSRLPWHLPEDFKWFKKMTTGQVVVMGRKTFDSIGKPLPNRITVVLSRSTSCIPGAQVTSDLGQLESSRSLWPERDIFICGGAEVYRQALPLCSDLFLTLVKREVQGDVYFPEFEHHFSARKEILDCVDFTIFHYQKGPTGIQNDRSSQTINA